MPQQCAYCAYREQKKLRVKTMLNVCRLSGWSQIKLHLLICQHVTLHQQTHHMEGVFSSDELSHKGQSWASDIPRCRSNCGRNQHSGPLWLIYRTLLLTHPSESLLRATHLQGNAQLTPCLKVTRPSWEIVLLQSWITFSITLKSA